MNQQLRIAVLVTDIADVSIEQRHGDMHAMFQYAFYQASLNHNRKKHRGQDKVETVLDRFDVVNQPPQYPSKHDLVTGKYQGVIITGSTRAAYDDLPWIHTLMRFIQDLQHQPNKTTFTPYGLSHDMARFKVPLIGVCFGHQIIARALGGICEPNPNGWEFGPTLVQLTEHGQRYLQSGNRTAMVSPGTINIIVHATHFPSLALEPIPF